MARRKKSNPLEDVLDLLAMLPWWACLVLAAVSYFLLHRLATPIQASDIQGQGGAMVGAIIQKAIIHGWANAGQYIVPLLCIAAAALSAWRRKERQTLVSEVAQARNADALDGMSWREFELLVGEAYRLQGYRVAEIGGGGPDGGVDLVFQLHQQIHNLRLNRHVQRRRRLVGNQQLRVAAERHGDHRALAHTAGKLVRILLGALLRVGDVDLL